MKTITEEHYIGDELKIDMVIDRHNGEYLETEIKIDGAFWVYGSQRIEFKNKLETLINEYRI